MEQEKTSKHTIKKLLKGDKSTFSEIYMKYFEPLCLYAYRFFPDKNEASEIVQDVMLNLWEKKATLHIDSIEHYLYRSVYNSCLNKLEHLKVHNKYVDYKRIKLLEIELEDFEQTFYQWEIRENLIQEIDNLTPKNKTIFEMRYMDSMRYKEIADKLGISERTVESHLQNTLKLLRNKLRKLL